MVKGGDKVPEVRISLRMLRSELDVNQEQFAKMINMPFSTYRKKEAGKSPFTLEEAYRIAKITKKSIDEIFFKV